MRRFLIRGQLVHAPELRSEDGDAESSGRRGDHILATKPQVACSLSALSDLEPRQGEKPSGQIPLLADARRSFPGICSARSRSESVLRQPVPGGQAV